MTSDSKKKLLIIGWDAADWKVIHPLVDAGLMPTLAKFIEDGCIGNLATLRPCLSPMLWTSIATGKTADKHGVLGFVEPLADASGVRLVGSTTRNTKAFWNIASQAGLKTHVVGWYASHPAEPINGVCVSDQFLDPGFNVKNPIADGAIHPPAMRDRFAPYRVDPRELGAADMLPFIPKLSEIDHARDDRPVKLAQALAACASIHAVATDVLANEEWDVAAVYYDAIDRVGHEFMPFHPPKLPHVSDRDFELYQHVITGIYRFHDMMLDTLLQLAGDDTTVILLSDHGFHSDHLRPAVSASTQEAQAAQWHRHYGIFAMKGPGVRGDERVYGATLLDIAPTILSILDLPRGEDMDGKVLAGAFQTPPKAESIKSWDEVDGESGMHAPEARSDVAASAAAIQQLVDLGYLNTAGGDGAAMAAVAAREAQFNLAVVQMQARRHNDAVPVLKQLHQSYPTEPRFGMSLAHCLIELQLHREAISVLKQYESSDSADVHIALAQAELAVGDTDSALGRLRRTEAQSPASVSLFLLLGNIYRQQNQHAQAEEMYRRAVAMDDDNEQAHYGLALSLLPSKRFELVAEHALRAISLVYGYPQAHYLLGVALDELNQPERAAASLNAAVNLARHFPEAHDRLAAILLRQGNVEQAMRHQRMARGDFSA